MYIRNRDALLGKSVEGSRSSSRRLLLDAVEYMLESCNSGRIVRESVSINDGRLMIHGRVGLEDIDRYRSVHVIGCGKAALGMAEAMNCILGDRIASGIIIVPDYVDCIGNRIGRVEVLKGTHPIPSRMSVEATERMLDLARDLTDRDLMIFLISGGSSSLIVKPYGITLEEKQEVTRMLLDAGARIDEINAVRKHLSQVKGGRLVEMLRADVVSLILSDVPCNRLDAVASGLTVEDSTTFMDAMLILKRYGIWDRVGMNVRKVIEDGLNGRIRETPKPGDPAFKRVRNFVLADNSYACMKAAEFFTSRGIDARIVSTKVHGEARVIGQFIASVAYEVAVNSRPFSRPVAMILGGETTVTLNPGSSKGRGGRNQELALSALISSRALGSTNWAMVAIGTDGIDGSSMNAGAIVDETTLSHALGIGLDMDSYLALHDSAGFFDAVGDSIVTGPTGTNLNDVIIVLV